MATPMVVELSAQLRQQKVQSRSYGTGEHFDDFETFNAESQVEDVGDGDIGGLLNKFQESGMLEKKTEMMDKFKKGVFTLRDMYDQFQTILGMGNIGSIMSMIPGLANVMPQGAAKDGTRNVEYFLTAMDSMTDDELDSKVKLTRDTGQACCKRLRAKVKCLSSIC